MSYTTDPSMNLFDENYSLFMDTSPFNDYQLFEFKDTTELLFGATYDNLFFEHSPCDTPVCDVPSTCNPADIMAPSINFDSLFADWSQPPLDSATNFNPPVTTIPPSQLMTPPQSLPSTPQKSRKTLSVPVVNIGLITPPASDKLVCRTRRFNASDSIYHLSLLNLNASPSIEQTVNPASVVASTAYTPSPPKISVETDLYTFSDESTSSEPSSSSSFRDSPPPVRRTARATGVQRVALGGFLRGRRSDQPVPSGDPERPHGCRHPGRTPEDLPCNLDFARKHDWSRHQRVHTGETPYCCRGCDRPFKRPDARGRHWDSRPECEVAHTTIVRELLLSGEMTTEDRDVPVLRRRAQKAECRRESKRTGVPISELKAIMRQVKIESVDGFGF